MSDSPSETPAPENKSLLVKAVAGVFATVLAPVLVAFGIKFSDVIVEKITGKPEAAKTEPAAKDAGKSEPAPADAKTRPPAGDSSTVAGGKPDAVQPEVKPAAKPEVARTDPSPAGTSPATAPAQNAATGTAAEAKADNTGSKAGGPKLPAMKGVRKKDKTPEIQTAGPVVRLFNLKDSSGWYKYVDKSSKTNGPPGRNVDPDGVFKVAGGTIRISGEYWGTLTTEKEYDNYQLTVEFRWGKKTWGTREQMARQSGVLLHGFGADGAHLGWAPQSIKCQIIEGGTGDLVCYNVKMQKAVSISVESTTIAEPGEAKKRKGAVLSYKPGAPQSTISQGIVRRLGNGSDWRDTLDFHRVGDIEKATGDWNTLECICLGDRITIRLNGKVVNEAVDVTPTRGRISLQSHGAEIIFRKVELQPLAAK